MGIVILLIIGLIVLFIHIQISKSKDKVFRLKYEQEIQNRQRLENEFQRKTEQLSIRHPGFSDRRYYPYILIASADKRKTPDLPYREEVDPIDVVMNRVKKTLTGKNEIQFALKLMSRIGKENIVQSLMKYSFYTPDIIYFDKHKSILIDIEIDEPYALKDCRELHYRNTVFDRINDKEVITDVNESRDSTFLHGGWSVVRFSEEQVVKYPEECILIIQQLICYLSLSKIEMTKLSRDILHPRWTSAEARQKAKLKTR